MLPDGEYVVAISA